MLLISISRMSMQRSLSVAKVQTSIDTVVMFGRDEAKILVPRERRPSEKFARQSFRFYSFAGRIERSHTDHSNFAHTSI